MARPERNTVDYFPHLLGDGKKMYFIEKKYGNDGYATWFKILEKLALTELHFLNLSDSHEVLFMAAKCNIDENRLLDIINDLAKIGAINQFLWENKVIWSDKFIESIQDAYERRKNNCITFEGLCTHLLAKGILKQVKGKQNADNNTQSKVEDSKPKKSKLIEPPSETEFLNYAIEMKPDVDKEAVKLKFKSWIENDWKTGKDKPIKNWKSTLTNTLQYIASQKGDNEKKWVELYATSGGTGKHAFFLTKAEVEEKTKGGFWKTKEQMYA